jgi:hypothetical protein
MPTRLHFAKEESLVVDEDVSAVESAFRTAPPSPAPLVELTMKEKKVFVNVATVRYFQEHKPGTARVVSF